MTNNAPIILGQDDVPDTNFGTSNFVINIMSFCTSQ
jgi:hypothetical protein